MMTTPFEEFDEIQRINTQVTITEKIHGTNAQIYIGPELVTVGAEVHPADGPTNMKVEDVIKAGSRKRWVTPEDDNYGFARWVEANKDALIKVLGPGRHYGEWFGSGIEHGYGLAKGEKRLALFNVHRWSKVDLSSVPGLTVVPVLYQGPYADGVITEVMAKLKLEGSKVNPGVMNPEGIVIRFERNGVMFKNVFKPEESAWSGQPKENRTAATVVDEPAVLALLQPMRLEKLLLRDERYVREYPKSLPDIAKDYVADLEKEGQTAGVSEANVKSLRRRVFGWIKQDMEARGYQT